MRRGRRRRGRGGGAGGGRGGGRRGHGRAGAPGEPVLHLSDSRGRRLLRPRGRLGAPQHAGLQGLRGGARAVAAVCATQVPPLLHRPQPGPLEALHHPVQARLQRPHRLRGHPAAPRPSPAPLPPNPPPPLPSSRPSLPPLCCAPEFLPCSCGRGLLPPQEAPRAGAGGWGRGGGAARRAAGAERRRDEAPRPWSRGPAESLFVFFCLLQAYSFVLSPLERGCARGRGGRS